MRTNIASILFLVGAAAVISGPVPVLGEVLHCQPLSEYDFTGLSNFAYAEQADDLPDALAGQGINSISFYVSVFDPDGVWSAPDGIVIRVYQGACPPAATAALAYSFDWDDLSPELIHTSLDTVEYQVTATLPETLVIAAGMSLGLSALTSWGSGEWPICGFGLAQAGEVQGCGSAWYDSQFHPRWTQELEPPYQDLAFCLEGVTVPVETLTWGEVRALYQ